jgi:hypothetical protein
MLPRNSRGSISSNQALSNNIIPFLTYLRVLLQLSIVKKMLLVVMALFRIQEMHVKHLASAHISIHATFEGAIEYINNFE